MLSEQRWQHEMRFGRIWFGLSATRPGSPSLAYACAAVTIGGRVAKQPELTLRVDQSMEAGRRTSCAFGDWVERILHGDEGKTHVNPVAGIGQEA
jgi:hypothetical protein